MMVGAGDLQLYPIESNFEGVAGGIDGQKPLELKEDVYRKILQQPTREGQRSSLRKPPHSQAVSLHNAGEG